MNKQIKKLQLNKETIARLDQTNIFGGEPNISRGYKCIHPGNAVVMTIDARCGGGGIVSDDCGSYTGYTNDSWFELPCWGHECW